ncbi:MAG TPA: S1C family serine protease [Acidimicrobiales bacterium]|nr:S1C family serine protease [Acidimicrobiales bacterium]
MATVAEELSKATADVAARVAPSVVGVGAGGSGVVVGPGLVVTNAHNIRRDEVVVTFADGRRADGRPAGVDVEGDLAVVAVETADAPALAFARSTVRMGDAVLALANPGGRAVRVSVGFVSSLDVAFRGPGGRRVGGAIEHTAPLARGSSGGPVVDVLGNLVGIDTHRVGDGFYLALPADQDLKNRVDALSRGDVPRRPRLGIAIAPPRVARRLRQSVGLPERDGLLVHAVEEGGAADRAGIRQGDLVVRVGATNVTTVDELAAALESSAPDAPVAVLVVRGADEVALAVDFAEIAD